MPTLPLRHPAAGRDRRLDAVMAVGVLGLALLFPLSAYFLGPFVLPVLLLVVVGAAATLYRPVVGVMGAFLVSPLNAAALPLPSGALSPSEGAMALVGTAYVLRLVLRPETVRRPQVRDLPWALLVLVALSGLAVAEDPSPILRVCALWTLFLGVFLQVQSFTDRELRAVVVAAVVGTGLLGAMGTLAYLRNGGAVVSSGGVLLEDRAAGSFDQPNYYASYLQLALLPGLALLLARSRNVWMLVPLGLAFTGLALSLSRGATMGFAVGLLLLLGWNRARRVAIGVAAVVTVLTLANANPIVGTQQFSTVVERLQAVTQVRESSTNNRPRIWQVALDGTAAHPWNGIGLNQFEFYAAERGLTEYGSPLENAHNLLLGVAVETGLLGLAAFLVLLGQLALRARRATGHPDPVLRALGLGIAATLLAFFVQGLTAVQIRDNLLTATFLTFAGMLTAIADRRPRSP